MTWRPLAALGAAVLVAATACGGSSSTSSTPASSAPGATSSSTPTATPNADYTAPPATLPAIPVQLRATPAPWLPPAVINGGAQSAAYVTAAGFSYAGEMLQVHYHAHLDIEVDGKPVVVPPYIGFVVRGRTGIGLAPLHTHDSTGIIHIENSVPAKFVLGQVFIEWGVKFTPTCLGSYCSGHGKELAVFVNGKRYSGDPTQLVLAKHQEIAIEYGAAGHLPKPPASYPFPPGD